MPFGSASAPSSNNPTPVFGASAAQPAANPFGANSAAAKPAFNFGGAAAPAAFGAGGEISAVNINPFCAVVMKCGMISLYLASEIGQCLLDASLLVP